MADENVLDGLKKLPPKERIKKLKELQEKNKKEIDEASKMLRDSEDESILEDALEKVPIPEIKSLTIEDIFGKEEKKEPKTKKEEEKRDYETEQQNLERVTGAQPNFNYNVQEHRTMNQLRDDLYSIQRDVGNQSPTQEQRQELYQIGKELYEKENAVNYMNDQHAKGEIQRLREKQKDLYSSRQ